MMARSRTTPDEAHMRKRRGRFCGALVLAGAIALTPVTSQVGAASADGRESQAAAGGCEAPVEPASQLAIEACDSEGRIIDKAAHIVPTRSQLAWQGREITAFTHFGMNTFTDREWGSGAESRDLFDPQGLDVAQWMRAYKAAGAEQVMLTAKHHDGLALWPSRYTEHTVAHTPWWKRGPEGRNPQGDILGEYVKEARKAGLKVGIYLSPADGAELPHDWHRKWLKELQRKKDGGEELSQVEQTALDDGGTPNGRGRYGNGSEKTERTIPTLVENDDRAEDVRSGKLPSFTVQGDDYDAYYLNQLYEVLTEYGSVAEIWFDGANPWKDSGLEQEYAFGEWFRVARQLAPGATVFGGPQGVRWVGNEEGRARESEWSVVPATEDPQTSYGGGLDGGGEDIGSREKLFEPANRFLRWYPAEADVSIRPGWYQHESEQPKSARELFARYEQSVGRNASLLLNAPPGRNGKLAEADVDSLAGLGALVEHVYGADLKKLGPGPYTFDRVGVAEDISQGQRVEEFAVEARSDGEWKEVGKGTTIGHRRIVALPEKVTADDVRVRVDRSRGQAHLKPVTLHLTGE